MKELLSKIGAVLVVSSSASIMMKITESYGSDPEQLGIIMIISMIVLMDMDKRG